METENSKTGAVSSRAGKKGHGFNGSAQNGQHRSAPSHCADDVNALGHCESTIDVETAPSQVDTRSSERQRVLKTGKIEINLDYANIPCMVRDISDTGAKIKVTGENLVPDYFTLHIPMDGFAVDCHVIRRNATDFGVEFVGDKRKLVTKKVQYIRATSDWATDIASMGSAGTDDQSDQAATVRPVNSSTQKANKPSFGRRGD